MAVKKNLLCRCQLLILFFLFATPLKAQVNAEFTIDRISGCSPFAVQFIDASTGSPDFYQWDLGNGNKPTFKNPATIYIDAGIYTVSLTVSKGGVLSTKTHNVTVFKNPVADFTASVSQGCLPLDVFFTDHTKPGSGTVNKWFWDFGDGTNSLLQNPVQKYKQSGQYTVALIVTDNNSCTNTKSISKFVSIAPPSLSKMAFAATPLTGCDLPFSVTFANTSSGNGLNYFWNFGDGQTSNLANPPHVYSSAGLYTVYLVGTNAAGCNDTLRKTSYVNILNNPAVNFDVNKTQACAYEPLIFTNKSAAEFNRFHWDFGNGDTSNDANPQYTYKGAGSFTVSLKTSFGSNCSRTTTKTGYIAVKASAAAFTSDSTTACKPSLTVKFKDQTPAANSWSWNFGDSSVVSNLQNPVHTFKKYGSFDVTLSSTTTTSSCMETVKKIKYIQIEKRRLGFKADKRKGCIPLTVAFTDTSHSGSPITSYKWDFGDSTTSTSQNPSHVFSSERKYDITLITLNSLGCTDTLVRPAYIKAGHPPTLVDFEASKVSACASQSIQFKDLSQHANGWFWEFGKIGIDSSQNPLELFRDTGRFDVTLTADYNGCTVVKNKPLYIYIAPPVARFAVHGICKKPFTFSFTERSIGANSWSWNYGDGSLASNNRYDTLHTYNKRGAYKLKLTIKGATGCLDSAYSVVNVVDPKANFSTLTTFGCPPLAVQFKDLSTNAASWHWNFGDNTYSTEPSPLHSFIDTGKFVVILVVDSLNCRDTFKLPNPIVLSQIKADFKIDTAFGCLPLTVRFLDKSIPATGITSYFWTFGDGNSSTDKSPSHVYTTGANYDVSLSIQTAACKDLSIKQKLVQFPPRPSPDFSIGDTLTCKGSAISFMVKTVIAGHRYTWDFGDGVIDKGPAVSHAYINDGTYTISLKVLNENGCDTSASRKVVIKDPVADFSAKPTFKSCPNLLADFKDLSSPNATSWIWDFGDTTGSALPNPSHLYTSSDSNNVQLVITTRLGCTATVRKSKYIVISGPKADFSFSPIKGCPPLAVFFRSKALHISKYLWDFGDGSKLGSGDTTSHEYTVPKKYGIKLILTDTAGCTIDFQSPDSIAVTLLDVKAGPNKYVCLHDSASIGLSGEGTTFSWTPSAGLSNANIAMPKASPAIKTVYTMTTLKGRCSSKDSVTVFVNQSIPKADFTYNKTCLNDMTQFTNASSITGQDRIKKYTWDFGDHTNSIAKDTVHKYATSAPYKVSLSLVTDSGCQQTFVKTLRIIDLPLTRFSVLNKCFKDSVRLSNESSDPSGIKDILWNLGDGKGSSMKNSFYYVYPDTGRYDISLKVTSNAGCTATARQTFYVNPVPVVNFSAARMVCLKAPVVFKDSSNVGKGKIAKWFWSFGDGQFSHAKDTLIAFKNPGTFTVQHKVTSDSGCSNVITQQNWIRTMPIPKAAFSVKPGLSARFLDNRFNFYNQSTEATTQSWLFGDGVESTLKNPIHTYRDTGRYIVALAVKGANMCPDTVKLEVRVLPDFSFYIANAFSPDGDGVNDTFNGKGFGIVSYKMELFDRWGNKMYESNSLHDSWDGRALGGRDISPIDIYVYKIVLRDVFLQTHYYNGHFSLIK